jgi:hypothetical protein
MEKLKKILSNSYWVIPGNELSDIEISFLKSFFRIKKDFLIDEDTLIEKKYYILEKKSKFLGLTI